MKAQGYDVQFSRYVRHSGNARKESQGHFVGVVKDGKTRIIGKLELDIALLSEEQIMERIESKFRQDDDIARTVDYLRSLGVPADHIYHFQPKVSEE